MAKRVRKKKKTPSRSAAKAKLSTKDRRTLKSLRTVADQVVRVAQRSRAPHLDIPSRSLSNVRYNKRKRFIEMGSSKNRRELFNLSQAKSYMQTMLVSSGCKQLIEQGKTTSIRGMYYLLKHTIEGTKEETFDDQADCDPVIEDVEVKRAVFRELDRESLVRTGVLPGQGPLHPLAGQPLKPPHHTHGLLRQELHGLGHFYRGHTAGTNKQINQFGFVQTRKRALNLDLFLGLQMFQQHFHDAVAGHS